MTAEATDILRVHYLKTLKLPTFQREYQKLARLCATEGVDHVGYLVPLAEREIIERDRRKVERRIKTAKFPVVKSLDNFDLTAIPQAQQGAGTGTMRMDRAPGERHRSRPKRHWQDACRARSRPGRMPEGPVRRLHNSGGLGQRHDGGARRAASPPVPEAERRCFFSERAGMAHNSIPSPASTETCRAICRILRACPIGDFIPMTSSFAEAC